MITYQNFRNGISIIPKGSTESNVKGELEVLSSDNKLRFHNGTVNDPVVTETAASQGANRLKNKDLEAGTTKVVDGTDATKKLAFQTSGATTGTSTTLIFAQTTDKSITFPDITDTVVTLTATQTLTNKTISGSSNTLSNIANASLVNDSITINGVEIELGGSEEITAENPEALTIGTGLTGTSYDGSAAVTITIDSTVVTLTGSQTLTNKTLTSSVLTNPTSNSLTGSSGNDLTIQSATDEDLYLNIDGTGSMLVQNNSDTIFTVDANSIILGAAKRIIFTNNSQTVTLDSNSSASESYTVTWPAEGPEASTALVFDGTNFVWSNAGGWTVDSDTSLTAGGTISISTTAGQQVFTVASSSGAIALSNTPFGSTDPIDGASIRLIGTSDTNTVQINDADVANGCRLNGPAILHAGDVIEFQYISSSDRYFEVFRNF